MKSTFRLKEALSLLKTDKSIAILKLEIAVIGLIQAFDTLKDTLKEEY